MPSLPESFRREAIDAARAHLAGKLALLAYESKGTPWEREAADLLAREQKTLDVSTALGRTILFTGHQVDAPGRKEARFPQAKESVARTAIRHAVEHEAREGPALGIAGAASGGDILFHEVC